MIVPLRVILTGQTVSGGGFTKSVTTARKFQKTFEIDLDDTENVFALFNREINIGLKPTLHLVSITSYKPIENLLEGQVVASRNLCNGYLNDLKVDGWEEIPLP